MRKINKFLGEVWRLNSKSTQVMHRNLSTLVTFQSLAMHCFAPLRWRRPSTALCFLLVGLNDDNTTTRKPWSPKATRSTCNSLTVQSPGSTPWSCTTSKPSAGRSVACREKISSEWTRKDSHGERGTFGWRTNQRYRLAQRKWFFWKSHSRLIDCLLHHIILLWILCMFYKRALGTLLQIGLQTSVRGLFSAAKINLNYYRLLNLPIDSTKEEIK